MHPRSDFHTMPSGHVSGRLRNVRSWRCFWNWTEACWQRLQNSARRMLFDHVTMSSHHQLTITPDQTHAKRSLPLCLTGHGHMFCSRLSITVWNDGRCWRRLLLLLIRLLAAFLQSSKLEHCVNNSWWLQEVCRHVTLHHVGLIPEKFVDGCVFKYSLQCGCQRCFQFQSQFFVHTSED